MFRLIIFWICRNIYHFRIGRRHLPLKRHRCAYEAAGEPQLFTISCCCGLPFLFSSTFKFTKQAVWLYVKFYMNTIFVLLNTLSAFGGIVSTDLASWISYTIFGINYPGFLVWYPTPQSVGITYTISGINYPGFLVWYPTSRSVGITHTILGINYPGFLLSYPIPQSAGITCTILGINYPAFYVIVSNRGSCSIFDRLFCYAILRRQAS